MQNKLANIIAQAALIGTLGGGEVRRGLENSAWHGD